MARIRSVKPEFWADPGLARLDRDARLLYIALWNFADEHGRLHGDPRFIKGQAFPYDDDLTTAKIGKLLAALEAAGKVVRYVVSDDPYLYLPKLAQHQRLEADKVPSRLPGPDESAPPSASTCESRADEPARDADSSALLYVAGGRGQVAGSSSSARADGDGFDAFWEVYPRKVGKDTARKAWTKARKRAEHDVIVAGLRRSLPQWRDKEPDFIPHPSTWLNGGRWQDELKPTGTTPPQDQWLYR